MLDPPTNVDTHINELITRRRARARNRCTIETTAITSTGWVLTGSNTEFWHKCFIDISLLVTLLNCGCLSSKSSSSLRASFAGAKEILKGDSGSGDSGSTIASRLGCRESHLNSRVVHCVTSSDVCIQRLGCKTMSERMLADLY